jgi:hypothetical protein
MGKMVRKWEWIERNVFILLCVFFSNHDWRNNPKCDRIPPDENLLAAHINL